MTRFVTEVLLSELQQSAQLMRSCEADLEAGTWSFRAEWFQAGGGEYLIISKRDFDAIRLRFRPESAGSAGSET